MTTKSITHWGGLVAVAVLSSALFYFAPSAQAATCTFTRDLNLGMTGEDVRCLQQYLNNNGYTIAETGPGSKGNETGEFKALTEAAVKKWQTAKGITPATGSFGPKSRALLGGEQSGGGTVLGVDTSATTGSGVSSPLLQAILTRLTALERRIDALEGKKPTVSTPTPTTPTPTSGGKAEQAAAAIDELDNAIADAEDEIAEADDDGDRVDVAEDLLDEVVGMLTDAEDQYDEKNYDRVLVITKRALPLVAEAVDAIGKRSKDDDEDEDEDEEELDELEERLDELRDELEDARDEVEEAEDNDENTGDAEDLLDEAKDALDDAEEALDDEDANEAEDLLDEAEDLLEEALDEL